MSRARGGAKRIATVVRFSKFFFAWKIQKNDDAPLFPFYGLATKKTEKLILDPTALKNQKIEKRKQ